MKPAPKTDRNPLETLDSLVMYPAPKGHMHALHVICTTYGTFFIGDDWNVYTARHMNCSFITYRNGYSGFHFADVVLKGLLKARYITSAAIKLHKERMKKSESESAFNRKVGTVTSALFQFGLKLTTKQARAINKLRPV